MNIANNDNIRYTKFLYLHYSTTLDHKDLVIENESHRAIMN